MKAITKVLAGGLAVAGFAAAAPAAAQYYPGYGSPYGYGGYGGQYGGYGAGNVVGAIINSVIGNGGYNGYAPYGNNAMSQAVVNQCANAVQARLSGGGYGYGGAYGGYGGGYGGGRVVGISRVESGALGAIKVRGVASSGGAYGQAGAVDLVWKCKADPSGRIIDLQVSRPQSNYGYNTNQYTPWNDYSQYGYRRY